MDTTTNTETPVNTVNNVDLELQNLNYILTKKEPIKAINAINFLNLEKMGNAFKKSNLKQVHMTQTNFRKANHRNNSSSFVPTPSTALRKMLSPGR